MRAFFFQSLPENPFLLVLLVLFFAIFIGTVLWQLQPSKRAENDRLAHLPLQD